MQANTNLNSVFDPSGKIQSQMNIRGGMLDLANANVNIDSLNVYGGCVAVSNANINSQSQTYISGCVNIANHLNLNSDITWQGTTFYGQNVASTLQINGHALLQNGEHVLSGLNTIINGHTIVGSGNLDLRNGTQLTVNADFEIQGNSNLLADANTGMIINGLLIKSGIETSVVEASTEAKGGINVTEGTLYLSGAGTQTSVVTIAKGAQLNVMPDFHALEIDNYGQMFINYQGTQLAVPPTPLSAPTINNLPTSDQNFYGGIYQTLQNHSEDFSPDSKTFISTKTVELQPLIDPNSQTALKKTATILAQGAKTFGDVMDLASTFTSTDGLIRGNDALSDMTDIWSLESVAFDQAGVQAPTTNYAPLDILNMRIGAITTLANAGKEFSQGNLVAGLFGLNAFIYKDWLAPELEQFTHDPADPNFQTIYQPAQLTFPTLPTTGNTQLDLALAKQIQTMARTALYLQAVNASFDKYAGAVQAGDNIYATLQMEAVLNYLSLYNQGSQDAALATTDLQTLLTELGFGGDYDSSKFEEFQTQLESDGLSSDALAYYTSLGYTQSDINNLEQEILNLNAASFSANLADANSGASTELLLGRYCSCARTQHCAFFCNRMFALNVEAGRNMGEQ